MCIVVHKSMTQYVQYQHKNFNAVFALAKTMNFKLFKPQLRN